MFSYVQLCAHMCGYVRGAPVRLFNVNYPAREGLRPYGPKTAATINNFNWSSKLTAFRARQRFSVLLRPLWFPFGSNMQAPSNPGAAIATPKVTRQFVFLKWPAVGLGRPMLGQTFVEQGFFETWLGMLYHFYESAVTRQCRLMARIARRVICPRSGRFIIRVRSVAAVLRLFSKTFQNDIDERSLFVVSFRPAQESQTRVVRKTHAFCPTKCVFLIFLWGALYMLK